MRGAVLTAVLMGVVWWRPLEAGAPRVLDDRLQLELVAEHPQVVTPTGIDVDAHGRVWVIESHTHFPPDGYQGHSSDRVLILEVAGSDRGANRITVFADGLKHAMSVAVQPLWWDVVRRSHAALAASPDGKPLPPVYVATRGEILRLRDTDGDFLADERLRLVHLETPGNYPHNGLAGFAFDALGWMYFGFGENLGEPYKIIGRDGTTLSGGGEGGNLYRCRTDGSHLEHVATGFWNPHASCFDAFGRLFTVDNDPDSRPPCRLLHILPGGDYGYRFRNGRRGTHPFTSWNGEIPGTLPMVSGTGEAPSGIICYESEGFPADYQGTLLVGSWGDHRIDQFVLQPKGASFTSRPRPIVQGDEEFRPVGLALAPDGSVYLTDWVLRDYKLHGRGRVWKLSAQQPDRPAFDRHRVVTDPTYALEALKQSRRLETRRLAARLLARQPQATEWLRNILRSADDPTRARVETLWAISQVDPQDIDFRLSPATAAEEAPLGGRFDEMVVAAVPLLGTPQFPCAEDGAGAPRYFIDPAVFKSPQHELIAQWDVAWNLREDSSCGIDDQDHVARAVAMVPQEGIPISPASDPFVLASEIVQASRFGRASRLYEMGKTLWLSDHVATESTEWTRLTALLAARRAQDDESSAMLRLGLTDDSPMVRRAAVQWVGEARMTEFRWLIEALLDDPRTTPELLLACLASLSLLDGVPPSEFEKQPPAEYALGIVRDQRRASHLRASALRLIPPGHPGLKSELLLALLQSPDQVLQAEVVYTLQQAPRSEALPVLMAWVEDGGKEAALRAECLLALCALFPHEQPLTQDVLMLLLRLIRGEIPVSNAAEREMLQREALRGLRGRVTAGSPLSETLHALRQTVTENASLREALDFVLTGQSDFDPRAWNDPQPASLPADPRAGRRVFFAHQGPLCARCHTVHGRGGKIGPDLSVIARTMNRQKLIESILEPSREISPYFLTWVITTKSGKVHTGMIVSENNVGDIELGDQQGQILRLQRQEIEERAPSPISVMPQGLHQRMTRQEFADLLAYLETLD